MVYDSNSRGPGGPRRDYTGGRGGMDYGRDFGGGRDYSYSSARDYEAADEGEGDRRGYGDRDYGNQRYGQREQMGRGRDYGRQGYGAGQDRDRQGRGREAFGSGRDYYGGDRYRGAYGSDGRPFEDYGRESWRSDDRYGDRSRQRDGGRRLEGYDYDDRGFFARAGDEVRSWFGDEDAERRRDRDARLDERYANDRDSDYHNWRRGQMDALDRDYSEYRQENRSKFESEFSSWRTARQGQRDSLSSVKEHQEVVGSDGKHVGTVDKVRGDRILLTKNDTDAGGRHHSIPSRWIDSVSDKVKLSKTADEAKAAWQDEENRQAMSGWGDRTDADRTREDGRGGTDLNRSFSGTY